MAIFSGRIIYIFGIPERLRTLRYAIFTGGVVKANGICSACFLRKQQRCGEFFVICQSASLHEGGGKPAGFDGRSPYLDHSSSHCFAVPAPSEMGPLAKPRRSPAKDKLSRTAKGSLCEGAAERSEAEGVLRHRNQILHKMYKDSPLEQLDASVQERVLLYNRYNPQQNRPYYPCKSGTGEFSTGRKACGLCILHRKCAP